MLNLPSNKENNVASSFRFNAGVTGESNITNLERPKKVIEN
tara:strand:+ start:1075 stop:1197 length:123 start_codon:yes stop_codon:yes gene_type:complete